MNNTIDLIHQVYITDNFEYQGELPAALAENTNSLKHAYPDATYRLWNGSDLREFIGSNFDKSVLTAFDILKPYAYKCDLARFCLLFHFGGLYVDLGIRTISAIRPPATAGLASFRDYELLSPSWSAIAGCILWAKPRRREFEIAIKYVISNCTSKYYGSNPLYPTGPVLLGRALVAAMAERRQQDDADDQWIGVTRPLTPGRVNENCCYIAPDQTFVGLRIKGTGGDLTSLGARGTNNYNAFWHGRCAYGEVLRIWHFDDPSICLTALAKRTETGITAKPDAIGRLSYGPYIDLDPGRYRLSIFFRDDVDLPRMLIDITEECGSRIVHLHEICAGRCGAEKQVTFEFNTETVLHAFEFRVETFGVFETEIQRISLELV